MGVLERLLAARDRLQKKAEAREARRRRNQSVAAQRRLSRKRRVKEGRPRTKRERAESTAAQARGIKEEIQRLRRAKREAQEAKPESERSALRRAASAVAGGAKRAVTALEFEAERADRQGKPSDAVAARAEDAATAGPPIRGASLDPTPGGTVEALARGRPLDEESHGEEASGLYWENLITGQSQGGDRDGDGVPERDPLEFDDPFGLTGGGR